jgi:hypothetical protein
MVNKPQTPYSSYEEMLKILEPERLGLILRDQELIRDGWEIHFAIDPYDIGSFCFPFPADNLIALFKESKIGKISRLQNGRFEAIYKLPDRPILLTPYIEELDAIRNWAEWSKFVRTDAELLDQYIQQLRIPVQSRSEEIREALLELGHRDISSLIAVVTGIASIGFKRFHEVTTKRLARGFPEFLQESAKSKFSERDEIVKKIYKVLEAFHKARMKQDSSSNKQDPSDKWKHRSEEVIELNNKRDARAFDQILQLNDICNPHKHLILYLSTSVRSLSLSKDPGIQSLAPIIENQPYDLIRTANDLFLYMVYRGDAGSPTDKAKVAIALLGELRQILEDVGRIRNTFKEASLLCQHCNVDEKLPRCDLKTHCEGVLRMGEHLIKRQELNMNLSLQKRLAQVFQDALQKYKKSKLKASRYEVILDTISEFLKDKPTLRVINEELAAILQGSVTKAHFVSTFVTSDQNEEHIEASCHLNYYPVRLRVFGTSLKDILNNVIDILPRDRWSVEQFERCVNEYLKLDADWGEMDSISGEVDQSELVRCFLYLIMAQHKRSRSISEAFLNSRGKARKEVAEEFRYLQCFSMWKLNELEEALKLATEGIAINSNDARFYHCRSLVTYYQIKREGVSAKYDKGNVVQDALRAVELFSDDQDQDMIAVNYNNLAYNLITLDSNRVLSFDELEKVDEESINLAEKNLVNLLEYIPEEKWNPRYPEFFHTKGTILCAKFLASKDESILQEALQAASIALKLFEKKKEHVDLKESILRYADQYHVQL